MNTKTEKLVGLSLSFCVTDILRGTVNLEDVEKIITGTVAITPEDWDALLRAYQECYWRVNPSRGKQIALQLLEEGKIEQPRCEGKEAHNIASGHWLMNGNVVRP